MTGQAVSVLLPRGVTELGLSPWVCPSCAGQKSVTAPRVLTLAQKKLAKTDIKGMKTMASFFGKK